MEKIVEEIQGWKTEIEAAKQEKATLEGKQSGIKEQLLTQFGCKDIAEAEKVCEDYKTEISGLETEIEKEYQELKVLSQGSQV